MELNREYIEENLTECRIDNVTGAFIAKAGQYMLCVGREVAEYEIFKVLYRRPNFYNIGLFIQHFEKPLTKQEKVTLIENLLKN